MFEAINWNAVWMWAVLLLLFSILMGIERLGRVLQHLTKSYIDLHMNELLAIKRRESEGGG